MSDELIARLEAATEGSRELDRTIAEDALRQITELLYPPDSPVGRWCIASLDPRMAWGELPHYTTSVDAALQLVPEGSVWSIGTDAEEPPHAVVTKYAPGSNLQKWEFHEHANAATPALALCVAVLKARQS